MLGAERGTPRGGVEKEQSMGLINSLHGGESQSEPRTSGLHQLLSVVLGALEPQRQDCRQLLNCRKDKWVPCKAGPSENL